MSITGGYRNREESSRMSIEQSKDKTSPNLDINMLGAHGNF